MRNHAVTSQPVGLGPGDHTAWVFDGPAALDQAAEHYLAEGLRAGARCTYVLDERPGLDRVAGLGDAERLVAEGRLVLRTVDEVYGVDRHPDLPGLLTEVADGVAAARAQGFTGLRVVTDGTSLADVTAERRAHWLRWEQLIDGLVAATDFVVMCAFDRRRLAPWVIEELSALHPIVSAGPELPPFRLFAGGDGVALVGSVDGLAVPLFRRVLAAAPPGDPLVVDLSATELLAHGALVALAGAARGRTVVLRHARPIVRRLWSLLDLDCPGVRFEADVRTEPGG